MALANIRLGDYIERSTANNKDLTYGNEYIVGVNSQGIFTAPKGNTDGVDLQPYKIVDNGAFVYTPTRINLGSIAYRTQGRCLVSHLYIVFYLTDEGKRRINPTWLYMYLRRKEFGREIDFRLFGSARPEFSFSDICETIIPLPDIETQNKYVAIHRAMIDNQQSYERGLEDLKLTIDALVDDLKHTAARKSVRDLLAEVDNRNSNGEIVDVQGINIFKQFMPSIADTTGVDLSKYKVVKKGQFAYSGMQTGRDECIRIALFNKDEPVIISPAYTVFEIKDGAVLPEYIMMWFSRKESDRRGWFMSDSSIRTNLDLERFYEIEIPVPNENMQKSIVDLYKVYTLRRSINEQLKTQIKDICPILIRGSLEE